jgi:hypothetical protein
MNKPKEEKKEFTIVEPKSDKPAVQVSRQRPQSNARPQAPSVPITFDAWWLRTQNKYKFKPELKKAVQRHFEARGFTDYTKFDAGLRDFGFRT